jgi:protein-S-isoprenylcysteine O-methyltransferase Ste14
MLNAVSLGSFVLMLVSVLGLARIHSLFSPAPAVIALQCGAAALMVWARVTFGRRSFQPAASPTGGGLVTTGPYRFIRHPIYTAVCLFCWAGVAVHFSPMAVLLGALLFLGSLGRMLCEERLVTRRYPAYRDYARRTRRMLPYVF